MYTPNSCFHLVLFHKNHLKYLTLSSLLLILENGQQASEKAHGLLEKKLLSIEEKRENLGQVLCFFFLSPLVSNAVQLFFLLYTPTLSFPPLVEYNMLREAVDVYVTRSKL